MTIARIIHDRAVVAVDADMAVTEVIALLARHRIGAVPVLRDGQVAGIFSERDVIRSLAEGGAGALDTVVGQRMTTPVVTVTRDQSVLGALALMTDRRIRHLPVVEGDALVGFVSIGDLVKHRIDGIEAEASAMRDYIQQG
ncbi:hypothetical protein ASG37_14115 [Sphingomonas sp. Leaf407]|uniref:CBS domain-containing protein n=1 Tax=unclassified Sphingomonas TaxID=196159 RepID=UPI0006F6A2A0|nr:MULTISPECIES: CBS domain-containing protein [unclassified Sphingomonas]KQN35486.1 hypothetical protein ASE97_13370 [Sphingomonas sp. Leaf42]KQT26353.1 hypothetical protein ASG37_14115 [Sphingomonas sp. Leaf407]